MLDSPPCLTNSATLTITREVSCWQCSGHCSYRRRLEAIMREVLSRTTQIKAGPADGRFWVDVRQSWAGTWDGDDADKLSVATGEERCRDKLGLGCASLPRPMVLSQSAIRLVGNCPLDESAFESTCSFTCKGRYATCNHDPNRCANGVDDAVREAGRPTRQK